MRREASAAARPSACRPARLVPVSTVAAPAVVDSPWLNAQRQFDNAAEILQLSPGLRAVLREVRRELVVRFPVKMDNGTRPHVRGLPRPAQRDPRSGQRRPPLPPGDRHRRGQGARDVDDLEVRADQPSRTAAPRAASRSTRAPLSHRELERLTRRFAAEISVLVGPESDIPAPDVNTNAEIMAWIMDTLSMQAGYSVPASVTGKPLEIGGSEGRPSATGRGVNIIAIEACKRLGREPSRDDGRGAGLRQRRQLGVPADARVRASPSARFPTSPAVSTRGEGLDIPALLAHRQKTGGVQGFPGTEPVTNSELLELEVDVLVPAAMENQITARNAGRIQARLIVEGANGPTTPGRGQHPRAPRHHGRARHPRQLGRRDRLVLRVGAGPAVALLGGGRDQHPPQEDPAEGLPADVRAGRPATTCRCASAPTSSRSNGSPTPRRCGASTRRGAPGHRHSSMTLLDRLRRAAAAGRDDPGRRSGSALAGLMQYGFLVVAARALGQARFAPLSVFWALLFVVRPGVLPAPRAGDGASHRRPAGPRRGWAAGLRARGDARRRSSRSC